MKCFKYLGSVLTDDGRCTCEIKSRIAMPKAAFNNVADHFNIVGLRTAGVSSGRSMACIVS